MQAMLALTTYYPGVFILLPTGRPFSKQDNPIGSTEIVSWLTVFVL